MPNHRRNRINEAMRKELSLILREVKEPMISGGFITVTGAQVTPDLKNAKIFYSAMAANAEERGAIAAAFKNSAPFIRRRIAETLNLRITPELTFVYDESLDRSAHIDLLLRKIGKDKADKEETDKEEIADD